MPTQKLGMETNRIEVDTMAVSARRFWRHAATMPAGTATRQASSVAVSTTWAVTAKCVSTRCMTGSRRAMDMPRSPCKAWPTQIRNCSPTGRSRPSAWRISASSAGLSISPSISDAGSPGMARISANTSTVTTMTVGTAAAMRLSR
ncbi:hypothetical protein D3C87_1524560 [compost metagenome]